MNIDDDDDEDEKLERKQQKKNREKKFFRGGRSSDPSGVTRQNRMSEPSVGKSRSESSERRVKGSRREGKRATERGQKAKKFTRFHCYLRNTGERGEKLGAVGEKSRTRQTEEEKLRFEVSVSVKFDFRPGGSLLEPPKGAFLPLVNVLTTN
ncbi:hypothetical protein RUM43_006877 [Polyplax serrata]|uniref:Uncharacterized protein n=1 Tax=Polyplax serrata TaxID=468196 RepID=A0AAN8S557_POLSC